VARPTEPSIAPPEWATGQTVEVAGTPPSDANDVITPASADQSTGWAAGPGGPVRQFMNWLQRSAGEWLVYARNVLRETPYRFLGVVEAIEGTALDGTKPGVAVVDLTGSQVQAWKNVWGTDQGGATSNAGAVSLDGEYVALAVGSVLYVRERDTPSSAVFNATLAASIVDVSTCGDAVYAAAALKVRRYVRDGSTFGEITIPGSGVASKIQAAGDRLAVLWRDFGAGTSKVALYNASTLTADATFGTKSRVTSSFALAITPDLVIIGGPDDSGYADAYDRDTGTALWSLALNDSTSTPTVAAIAATNDRVLFAHAADDSGYEVTCSTASTAGSIRILWQKALAEVTPTIRDCAIDDRYAYVLTATTLHVLDVVTGQEEAQIDIPGTSGARRLSTDGDLVFVTYDYDATTGTNFRAFRVRRGAQLWRRHNADDRYRTRYTLLTPQR